MKLYWNNFSCCNTWMWDPLICWCACI